MDAHGLLLLLAGLNGEAALWAARMAHACVTGGLFIAGLWAVCRLAPRLPAALRASLWWLACLKLAFDVCQFAPVALPVLPATPLAYAAQAAPLSTAASPLLEATHADKSIHDKSIMTGDTGTVPITATAVPPSWLLGLQALWLVGVLLGLTLSLRQAARLRRIVFIALPAPLTETALNALAAQIGPRRAPRVLESGCIAAPCVTGLLRPTILLPLGLTQTLAPEDLRLALAHEMAHIKRGDLRLALLPALIQALFFFHPLVWLAAAEWASAREEACDAIALQATGAAPAALGRLLLTLAGGATRAPALGLSPGYQGLRRRLIGLSRQTASDRRARWLLVLVLPLLLPWHLTAASRTHSLTPSGDGISTRQYGITDLGEVADSGDSVAAALNSAGQVAGTARDTGESSQGVSWNNSGQAVPLGALPKHHYSIAYGINSAGQIAAASYNIPGHGRAFLWNGSPHRIGSLPGFPYSEARGVNDAGQVAGIAQGGAHDRWQAEITRAFLWQGGRMTDLGTLGGPYSDAYGLNNAGIVVGKSDTDTFGQTHAFAWQDSKMTDLGTLGGANSLAYRVNDSGQIVGSSETGTGDTRHAFVWQNGQMRDLGVLPGTAYSVANDINSQGDIVGCAQPVLDSPAKRAFLSHNGHLTDLNVLLPAGSGWTLAEARAINDKGQIAGEGQFHGHTHAFLLTPR